MEKIFEYLEIIEKTQGNNSKADILQIFLTDIDNSEEFFRIVFNDDIYGVSTRSFEKILDYDEKVQGRYEDTGNMMKALVRGNEKITFEQLKKILENLKIISGNKQLEFLKKIYNNLDSFYAKWLTRIILKNLRLGINLTTVNKIFKIIGKKEIKKFQPQLCAKITNIRDWNIFPCIASIKYDGFRAIITKKDKTIRIVSRSGKEVDFLPEIEEELLKYDIDFKIDGEVMAKNFNEIQKRIGRKEDNITITEDLHFRIFDVLELNDELVLIKNQEDRYEYINKYFRENSLFRFEQHILCEDRDSLIMYYRNACKNNEEGIIIKEVDKPYIYGARDAWTKVKPVHENSFRVVDFEYGSGKHKDVIGALWITDFDENILSKVGSGINDSDRELLEDLKAKNKLINSIVEVMYNEITNTNEGHSLRFPRFIKLRFDLENPDKIAI